MAEGTFLVDSSYSGKSQGDLWGPSYRGTDPTHEGFTLMT